MAVASAEYELLREDAGLVARAGRVKVVVRGGEAGDFLQGQVTNDVEALTPGEGCYAALLNHKGKLRADMRVLRGEEWFWLDGEAPGRAPLLHTLETYSLGRDVSFEDVSEARAILSLIGPAARERLDVAPPEREHAFAEGEQRLHPLHVADPLAEVGTKLGQGVELRCVGRPLVGGVGQDHLLDREGGCDSALGQGVDHRA